MPPASVKLDEKHTLMIAALALGKTQSDVLRDGLDLVWQRDGEKALVVFEMIDPAAAARLRELLEEG